jgi:PPM family protein phosphatase
VAESRRAVTAPVEPRFGTRGWGSPALVLDAAATSITGPRPDNQDAGIAAPNLLAVADGVGGNVGGARAAALVVEELARSRWSVPDDAVDRGLAAAVAAANGALRAAVAAEPQLASMATTLTAAALARDGRLAVAHIGDSRAYLFRGGELTPLTADHTLVQTMVDAGSITAEEARTHPLRSLLLAALHGRPDDLATVVHTAHEVRPGDRLLVCSDGVTGAVDTRTLCVVLAGEPRPADAVNRLLRAALAGTTRDNATAVVGDVVPAGPAAFAPPTVVGAAAARRRGATTAPVG